jgi:hypothetical protein
MAKVIGKADCIEFRKKMTALAKEMGYEVDVGKIRYTDSTMRCRVELRTEDAAAEIIVPLSFGDVSESIGRTFAHRTRTYTVIRIEPNRPKFPVLARRDPDGKMFKFPQTVLGKLKPAAVPTNVVKLPRR